MCTGLAALVSKHLIARRTVPYQLPRHPHETIDGWTSRDHRLETAWIRISDNKARWTTNLFTPTSVNFAHAGAPRLGPHRARNHLIGRELCRTRTALTVPLFATQPSVTRIYALSREIVVPSFSLCNDFGTFQEVRAVHRLLPQAFSEVFQSRLWDPRILVRVTLTKKLSSFPTHVVIVK